MDRFEERVKFVEGQYRDIQNNFRPRAPAPPAQEQRKASWTSERPETQHREQTMQSITAEIDQKIQDMSQALTTKLDSATKISTDKINTIEDQLVKIKTELAENFKHFHTDFESLQSFQMTLMENFSKTLGTQQVQFSQWLAHSLKRQALFDITKSSTLEDDWLWFQQSAFALKQFHEPSTIKYVASMFERKWLSTNNSGASLKKGQNVRQFVDFRHTSPLIV